MVGVTCFRVWVCLVCRHSVGDRLHLCFWKESFPRLHACAVLEEKFTHCSSQPWHMKTQMFLIFKNRTNSNKTITSACPLLTSCKAAKARVVWWIKNLWHHYAAFHENNKEEKLLINQMALSIMNQGERAGRVMCHIGSLSGSEESCEDLTKTLACCSNSLKAMRTQQWEKRLESASCNLTICCCLSGVLS